MIVLGDLRKRIQLRPRDVVTENVIFQCHSRLMFWYLLASSALVCARQYLGSHIDCISGLEEKNAVNTYCFFMTTFTLDKGNSGESVKRHAYYQWVPFLLFFQAVVFYLPHSIWKMKGKNKITATVEGLRNVWLDSLRRKMKINGIELTSAKNKSKKIGYIASRVSLELEYGLNRDWASSLILCEVLNFFILVLQFLLTDLFLDGQFKRLGYDWASTETGDVLENVFPKVTKCTFRKFGGSGGLQTHDALCVMALNIVNEKIYCVMWFLFASLFFLDCLLFLWRLLSFCLYSRSVTFNRLLWSTVGPARGPRPRHILTIISHISYSDWLFLYYIASNMDSPHFSHLISSISHKLTPSNSATSSEQEDTSD